MKGNPQVIAGLQEAANMEGSMMLQYLLDQRDVKRLGLDLADGLKQMKEQCEDHMKCLVSRVLFLEGAPTIELKPAATHDSVTEILNDAFAAEQAAIARFTDLCKQCYDAGDMSNFHFYQLWKCFHNWYYVQSRIMCMSAAAIGPRSASAGRFAPRCRSWSCT
jgi:bacterioferritin (cytochrome b1)